MKNRIIVFGGSMFMNMQAENKEYRLLPNKIVSKLEEKYILDNFSNQSLTSERSLRYLKEFARKRKYNSCILSLGEADALKNTPLEFRNNLEEILKLLKEYQIRPLLVSLPNLKKEELAEYQHIIDDIALRENIEYVYNGDTDMAVYKVKNESQMKRAILELCA